MKCEYRYVPTAQEFLFRPAKLDKACDDLIDRGAVATATDRELLDLCQRQMNAIEKKLSFMENSVRGLGLYPISAQDLSRTDVAEIHAEIRAVLVELGGCAE